MDWRLTEFPVKPSDIRLPPEGNTPKVGADWTFRRGGIPIKEGGFQAAISALI